jgi:hypothetical protein
LLAWLSLEALHFGKLLPFSQTLDIARKNTLAYPSLSDEEKNIYGINTRKLWLRRERMIPPKNKIKKTRISLVGWIVWLLQKVILL